MDVHVTSDVNAAWEGRVRWQLLSLKGETLKSGEEKVALAALASARVCALDFEAEAAGKERELVFAAELFQGEQRLSTSVAPFVPNKHIELVDPQLAFDVTSKAEEGKQAVFEIRSGSLARFVELKLEGADVVFSDNYVDVPSGWKVQVTCPVPAGWTLAKVKKALRVMSLYDSFA